MSSLKNIRSNEWNRLTGIPAIITGSPVAFILDSFDLVIPKTTQRVCFAGQDSAKQSSPTDSRPDWMPSQPSNCV
jgi:hypothetical protein